MLRYQTRRHRALMDESEQALWTAAEHDSGTDARIAKEILSDPKIHSLWEARHAELVWPVAEHGSRGPQMIALRDLEVRLIHRRALIDHIRDHHLTGEARRRLFEVFYGCRDFHDAVLAEHRQYMLAVSSRVSADHLIEVMHDSVSKRLLRQYEDAYTEYFDLYCFVTGSHDRTSAEASRWLMLKARKRAAALRERISAIGPDKRGSHFERQALLARSGRYPVLNYMG